MYAQSSGNSILIANQQIDPYFELFYLKVARN